MRQHTDDPSIIRHQVFVAPGAKITVSNHLFGAVLYSWWIFEVPTFEPGDIVGVLLDDIRGNIHGPYADLGSAITAAKAIQAEYLQSA